MAAETQTVTPAPVALRSRYSLEFEQLTRLGKGGFGRVYRARHILDGVEYAVKKVLLTGSHREQERAVREAMCLAKLDHPNIVRYYQVWKEEIGDDGLAEFDDSSEEEFDDDDESESLSRTEGDSSFSRSRTGGGRSSRGRRSARSAFSVDDESTTAGEGEAVGGGGSAVLHIQMQLCERRCATTWRRGATRRSTPTVRSSCSCSTACSTSTPTRSSTAT